MPTLNFLFLLDSDLQLIIQIRYYWGLDRRLPERERLNVVSYSHVRGKPQKLTFQGFLLMSELHLNLWRHIAQKLVMPYVQNPVNVGI